MFQKTRWAILLALLVACVCYSQSNPVRLDSTELVQRVKPSVALVLVGQGAGRLTVTASAL